MRKREISVLFEETFSRLVVAAAIGINLSSIARQSGVQVTKIHQALSFFRSESSSANNIKHHKYASRLTDRELMMIQRVLVQMALTLSAKNEEQIKTARRILEQEKQMGLDLKKAKRKRDLMLKEVQKKQR